MPYYGTDCKMWFCESLVKTKWPKDSKVDFLRTCGMWTPNAMKTMVEKSLEMNADFILIISVDVGWQSGDIERLINHNLDVVGGWAMGRFPPFTCHVADYIDVEKCKLRTVTNPGEHKGVEKIYGNGSELICYKADVFRKIPSPWFFGIDMVSGDRCMSEDYYFALQAKKHGIDMFVDWDVKLIHAADGLITHDGEVKVR
jgi:hypothetical protein